MADRNRDFDSAANRDFDPAPAYESESRSVVGYGADRRPIATYFGLFIGAVFLLGLVLFATGFFGSQNRDQANIPGSQTPASTTGQSKQ